MNLGKKKNPELLKALLITDLDFGFKSVLQSPLISMSLQAVPQIDQKNNNVQMLLRKTAEETFSIFPDFFVIFFFFGGGNKNPQPTIGTCL